MKTIKDYEKEFDEKDFYSCEEFELNGFIECECKLDKEQIKNYIFQELLPQVLNKIIYRNERIDSNNMNYLKGYTDCQDEIKQKAKEMGIKF